MYKIFFTVGIIFIILGVLAYLLNGHLFRLPGDIVIERENFSFYFPITSMILISVVLSLLFALFSKFSS
ncbi:DUF2905 domain-containing protein [Sulfurimonas paralvinellae]|uniref:DUF2905 domain-containing protein n=1 Tax=Sulfurimonas paralvinellae TaxID=317658 RepID=A0A7M1B8Q8_9BACT|nr:DUF2905 domain-containing protein [Sulfurimonas paralvinellae]QOP45198.1 DUF2905 domain-containing protein [Sulfurimonas paralvinellae]